MITQHYTNLETIAVTIVTCDPSTRQVQGQTKDGAPVTIAVWEIPPVFIWPQVGETWTVFRRAGGPWRLQNKIESGEGKSIESLSAGQGKIDSPVVVDSQGRTFIAVDLSLFSDGDPLKYDAATKSFVPGP